MSNASDRSTSKVRELETRLRDALQSMLELEMTERTTSGGWISGARILEKQENCTRLLGECITLTEALPRALEYVWTKSIAEEIVNLRSSLDTLRRRMQAAHANGFNHPILRVSNAPQEWKDDWQRHEQFLRYMANRLKALQIANRPTFVQETTDKLAAKSSAQIEAMSDRIGAHLSSQLDHSIRMFGSSPPASPELLQTISEWKSNEWAGQEVETSAPETAAHPEVPTVAEESCDHADKRRKGKKWQDVMKQAELIVRRNGGDWPGVNTMILKIDCGKKTLYTAIRNSLYLKARKAEYEAERKNPAREVPLTDEALDSVAQSREPDPVEALIAEQNAEVAHEVRQYSAARMRRSPASR